MMWNGALRHHLDHIHVRHSPQYWPQWLQWDKNVVYVRNVALASCLEQPWIWNLFKNWALEIQICKG